MAESHAVYRQGTDGAETVITIEEVRREYDSLTTSVSSPRARNAIRAGGLYCSHGASMTMVMGTKVNDHFRHVSREGRRAGDAEAMPSYPRCECAGDDHLRAQAALRDHDYKTSNLIVTRFMSCNKHTIEVFQWAKNSSVQLEMQEVNDDGKRFVTDVAFFEDDAVVGRIEVWKTHRTIAGSRGSCPFFEIRADHILDKFQGRVSGTVWLRAESSGEPVVCEECVAESQRQREHAQMAVEFELSWRREQAEAKRALEVARKVQIDECNARHEAARKAREHCTNLAAQKACEETAKEAAIRDTAREEKTSVKRAKIEQDLDPMRFDFLENGDVKIIHPHTEVVVAYNSQKRSLKISDRQNAMLNYSLCALKEWYSSPLGIFPFCPRCNVACVVRLSRCEYVGMCATCEPTYVKPIQFR